MSETPEEFAERFTTDTDTLLRDQITAAIRARDREQRISGACDLALALGWSTGHGESMDALIEESRDNLRRERTAVLEEAAAEIHDYTAALASMGKPVDGLASIPYRLRAKAAAAREGKA